MPKKKKSGGSGMPQGFDTVISGINDWNNDFHQNSDSAISWGQNNPWGDAVLPFVQGQMQGDMSTNPWMSRLYGSTGYGQDEALDYLRGFLGSPGQGGPVIGGEGGGTRNNPYGGRAGFSAYGGGGGGGTGRANGVPDSTVGSGWFSEHIQDLFDPSRLDPANNPTIAPMLDSYRTEAEESYYRGITDLVNQAEAGGRYGSGLYQAMRGQAFDEYSEANAQAVSAMMQHARDQAIQNQMEAMGLVNTRDIAAGQIAAQERAASMAARSAAAGNAAAAEDAARGRQLQAIQMMMGAGQFDMGLQGNMAQLLQQGQLGAMQGALGFGQLGMSGYDAAANFGQLGMGAMNSLGNIYQGAAANRNAQQRMAEEQRRWNEQAPIRDIQSLLGILGGLNDIGGYNDMPGYIPASPGPAPGGFDANDVLGGILGGLGTYYNWGGQQ